MPTIPASYPPRASVTPQVNYIRKTVNFNDAGIGSGYMFASIPLNSYILAVSVEVVTVFNAASTNVLTFGTTLASANELAGSGDINEAATGVQTATVGLGRSLTQTATAAVGNVTPAEGGVGIFAKYTQTGTPATTGKAVVIITYIPDNDG